MESAPRPFLSNGSVKVKVKVTLRLTASQSVSLGVEPPSGAHDQICFTVWHLRSCFCGASSLTRGRGCLWYMLLAFASAVFLGSESLGTRDHILLSRTRDFPFRRTDLFQRLGKQTSTIERLFSMVSEPRPLLCNGSVNTFQHWKTAFSVAFVQMNELKNKWRYGSVLSSEFSVGDSHGNFVDLWRLKVCFEDFMCAIVQWDWKCVI
jgi:hypothetical protein